MTRNLAQQQAEEAHHILGILGVILRLHEQSSRSREASDGREMIARQFYAQHGSPSWGSRGPHGHGQQVKARFIYEDNGSLLLLGFF